jgi:NAD(P)-dependent dehydrogenase (short-subunit alcohol dehydrogenase family)
MSVATPRIWFGASYFEWPGFHAHTGVTVAGASRGCGLVVVQRVHEAGAIAIAAVRNPDNKKFEGLQSRYPASELLVV